MRPNTALRIRERSLDDAVSVIASGVPVRKAAIENHVAKSTAFDRLKAVRSGRRRSLKRSALTDEEERQVVDFAIRRAHMGVLLTSHHLIESSAMFISRMPSLVGAIYLSKTENSGRSSAK